MQEHTELFISYPIVPIFTFWCKHACKTHAFKANREMECVVLTPEMEQLKSLTSEEEFDDVFSTNVKGVFNCTKNALPFMLEKGGNIVNIASMWGLVGASCESVYSASKSAIIGFTKSLAKEYASANIRVNAIASGYIDTKMNSCLTEEDKKLVIEDILLNRAGKPEEVASAVRFISESAKFMTGEVLNLSGGQVIV